MASAARLGCLLLLLGGPLPLGAQQGAPMVDFLAEGLVIPEAAQFDTAQYQASGAAPAFESAKRQSYDLGQYPQAAQRFAPLLQQYQYKSTLWVYLARAYFHSQQLEMARQTLARAGEVMPELRESFWQPLEESMLREVQRQAEELQSQVDFYPERLADFVPLIRLYRFLQDSTGALGVVRTAEQRRTGLYEQAEVAAGVQRQSYLDAAEQWGRLAGSLRAELDSASAASAPPPKATGVADSLKQAETLRLLQLRVDYYRAKPQEYQQLFAEYLRLGRLAEAGLVVAALEREGQRLALLATIAPNAVEEGKQREKAAVLDKLRQQLQAQLDSAAIPP